MRDPVLDYEPLLARLTELPELSDWAAELPGTLRRRLDPVGHGDLPRWRQALGQIQSHDWGGEANPDLRLLLQELCPWRKGPWRFGGVAVDTEWRSDWKWQRVAAAIDRGQIAPLQGQRILDVGCGNGYFGWRMREAGASLVLGIDSTLLYTLQFFVARHFLGDDQQWVLPLNIDELPGQLAAFDSVFSMGVLYHRPSPIEHLQKLKSMLIPGGQLVLETLIVDGDEQTVLMPRGRYAQMRNVWFIPSPAALRRWLQRCGFRDVEIVDCDTTSTEEQRSTDWMTFHSLVDFLDPDDASRTVEGYPAPQRAIIRAQR